MVKNSIGCIPTTLSANRKQAGKRCDFKGFPFPLPPPPASPNLTLHNFHGYIWVGQGGKEVKGGKDGRGNQCKLVCVPHKQNMCSHKHELRYWSLVAYIELQL